MSELIAPPSNWKFRLNLDAASLTSQLGTHRLLCIKSFLAGSTRLYSGVSVKMARATPGAERFRRPT